MNDNSGDGSLLAARGAKIEFHRAGRGERLLVLHGTKDLHGWHGYHDRLAGRYDVLAPVHPGFGLSERPPGIETIADLAYFYLDLIDDQGWAPDAHFSWEGKHFHCRFVNPFPRTYQQPTPPLWTSGDSEQDAERGGWEVQWYLRTRDGPWFRAPPGWAAVDLRKQLHQPPKGPGRVNYRTASYETLSELGLIIAGTPDQVVEKLERFHEQTGCGNVLMMMQAGPMANERVLASIRRFAEEVMPRVSHLGADADAPAHAEAGE